MLIFLLKLIGIILLSVIGLILVLLCLVLFAPIRYYAECEYGRENLKVNVKVTWLLIFRAYFNVIQKDFSYRVKILFFPIINSEKKKNVDTKSDDDIKSKSVKKSTTMAKTDDITKEHVTEENKDIETDCITEDQQITETAENIQNTTENTQKTNKKTEKKFHFRLLHPAEVFDIIITKILDICDIISKKLQKAAGSLNKICEMITSQENQEMLVFVLKEVKKLLKHVLPGKHGIYVKEGFADPSLTGQVLGAYSVLNNMLGWNFVLEPDFDKEVLEVRAYVKGRIRVFNLLIIGIRLYSNKTLRKLIRRK